MRVSTCRHQATFLAAIQAQFLSFTIDNTANHAEAPTSQKVINAFSYAGVLLDVLGACSALTSALALRPDGVKISQVIDRYSRCRRLNPSGLSPQEVRYWRMEVDESGRELRTICKGLVKSSLKGQLCTFCMEMGVLFFVVSLMTLVSSTQPKFVWVFTLVILSIWTAVGLISDFCYSVVERYFVWSTARRRKVQKRADGDTLPMRTDGPMAMPMPMIDITNSTGSQKQDFQERDFEM